MMLGLELEMLGIGDSLQIELQISTRRGFCYQRKEGKNSPTKFFNPNFKPFRPQTTFEFDNHNVLVGGIF
jgi:hypothetical protein